MTAPPPIPLGCAHRPTTRDGLVIPWGNVELADGGCDFRSHHHARWLRCWERGLCQVCGQPVAAPAVLLCGPAQLASLLFDEPPVHPECAVYVATACPMVAGERTHYATGPSVSERSRGGRCPKPGCDCGGWQVHPGTEQAGGGGGPAHEWFAVYVRGWALAGTVERGVTGGICIPEQVLRVRRVSSPGGGRLQPWETVPDWAAGYTAPEILGVQP
jgi:hypothetical protein